MDTSFIKIWAFLGFFGGVLSDISRLPNNTSNFVLLYVFGVGNCVLGVILIRDELLFSFNSIYYG